MLAVIATHPTQYHAPVYRALQAKYGIPVTAIYGSDFSARRYRDREFGADVTWDVDLLGGYHHEFLSRTAAGEEPDLARLPARGVRAALEAVAPSATLVGGYSPAFHRQAWYAAWRVGAPIMFRGEASRSSQSTNPLKRLARDAALGVAYRSCARVLYIGSSARQHYRAHGVPEERLVFSPYCVDTTPFRVDEQARAELRGPTRAGWDINAGDHVVLFAGKLSTRKGVDLIVAAAARLPAALRQRLVVLCAGDGDRRAAIEDAARAACVRLIVAGYQSQRALSRCYHAADVLVLPSVQGETWGLVVNEALHHGVPCIVSDQVGCAPDLIDGTTGEVCEAGSVQALAQAVLNSREWPSRAGLREACRRKVSGYSVDSAAAGLAEAYRAVTRGRIAA